MVKFFHSSIFFFLIVIVFVHSRFIHNLPSPRSSTSSNPKSWVSNLDNIINISTSNQINQLIDQLHQDENYWRECGDIRKGYEVALVLVEDLSLDSETNKKTAIQSLAKELHNRWGVGAKECSNGVLWLLSKDDREMYISTGKGVKHILTDSYLYEIIDEMRPYLRASQYNEGILYGVDKLINRLKYQQQCSPSYPEGICPEGQCCSQEEGRCDSSFCPKKQIPWFAYIFLLSVFGPIFWTVFLCIRDAIRKHKDKKRLDKLREELKMKKKIPTPLCPICLVDFLPETVAKEEEKGKEEKQDSKHSETEGTNEDDPTTTTTTTSESRLRKNPKIEKKAETSSLDKKKGKKDKNKGKEIETLVCGHQFHYSCITSWLKVKNSCPICRQDKPRDLPSTDDDNKPSKDFPTTTTQTTRYLDEEILDFAYLRLNTPSYAYSHVPYEPPSSSDGGDSDSGFGGGGSDGGGGAGGGW